MIRNIYNKSMKIIYIFFSLNVIEVFEMLHIVILVLRHGERRMMLSFLREFNFEDSSHCIFVKNDSM